MIVTLLKASIIKTEDKCDQYKEENNRFPYMAKRCDYQTYINCTDSSIIRQAY